MARCAMLLQAATALEDMFEETDLQAESLALEANLMQAQGKVAEALEVGRRASPRTCPGG